MLDSLLRDGLNDAFSGQHSAWHTEDLVSQYRISREDQDRWAARSQQRFSAGQAAGKFDAEIVAIELAGRKKPERFNRDEDNRSDTTTTRWPSSSRRFASTAASPPAMRPDSTAAPPRWAPRSGALPSSTDFSRGLDWSRTGGSGGAEPVRHLARACGPTRPGACGVDTPRHRAHRDERGLREMCLPEEIVNVEGGSIAHGHAIGATGAVLTAHLLRSRRRDVLRRGVVTRCIGGGQGVALALETL